MGSKKALLSLYGPRVFNVYKPAGMTSADVVDTFKKNLPPHFGKIGHFGTLDPFATGVLLIGIGQATRFMQELSVLPKWYRALGKFGVSTVTGDLDGDVEVAVDSHCKQVLAKLRPEVIARLMDDFQGEYLQRPPAFSATKHQGRPLYKWAREGVIIEKDPVARKIHSLECEELSGELLRFSCSVSTGTYIRVLFSDLAQRLGTTGALAELERTQIGPFKVADALRPEFWPRRGEDFDIQKNSSRIDRPLDFSQITLDAQGCQRFCQGNQIAGNWQAGEKYFVLDEQGELLGLGEMKGPLLWPSIVFKALSGQNSEGRN